MSRYRVYVDESDDLCTQTGETIREATPEEIEAAAATKEGYIACPEDVEDRLYLYTDGTTRLA